MMRWASARASAFACSMASLLSFSPCATMSEARDLASVRISATRFSAFARLCRPSSPAARPSAICFWRFSIARISGGQMNLAVNQMNTPKATACISSVRLMFITAPSGRNRRSGGLLESGGNERITERKQHRQTHADDERGVDQAEQQEYLGLQRGDHLWLPRCSLEEARAHDAHADARAECSQADDEADADAGECLDLRDQLQ